MSESYDHKKIEEKWQKIWEKDEVYKTSDSSKKPKQYILDMFPYPSGAGLHVGHPRGYIGSDVLARVRRMQGFNVLHPMGFDAFGLPAEQYAIQTGEHPSVITEKSISTYKKQLEIIGLSYDWSREVRTIDPEYYKWTQWIFLQLFDSYYDEKEGKAKPISELEKKFKKEIPDWKNKTEKEKQDVLMNYRLAYEGYSEVNWCSELGTVLANDEVLDGPNGTLVSERGGFPVEKKNMRQWFLRITSYAERLLAGLGTIDWPEHIKEIQRNWIGKSVGAEIEFKIKKEEVSTEIPVMIDHKNPPVEGKLTVRRKNIHAVVYSPERDAYLTFVWKKLPWTTIVVGGMDEGESVVETARREVREETGYTDLKFEGILGTPIESHYFAAHKNENREAITTGVYFTLRSEAQVPVAEEERIHNDVVWTKAKDFLPEKLAHVEVATWLERIEELKKAETIKVFTTRPDTLFGVTYLAVPGKENKFTGKYAVNPANGEEVPIWQADYVMEGYGTGAVMGVPAHDERDFEFAGKYSLKERDVIEPQEKLVDEYYIRDGIHRRCFVGQGRLINSGQFSGMSSREAKQKITEFVGGKFVTTYKMRDAIFARQRYWGEPIPLIHKDGLIEPLSEKKLPLELPNVTSYKPSGTGESPLAGVSEWVSAGYETNTMPGWAGSSWYFLRYMDPKNEKSFASDKALEYWRDVDVYVGGAEHATGHLLYSRFWHKFLHDLGHVPTEEPFKLLKNQGLIMASDGRKMSKRWGNVVNPDEMVDRFGADAFRLYEMFIGPFEQYTSWNTDGLVGTRRFLERVWKLKEKISNVESHASVHKTIKKVTEDIGNFKFNTCVSNMMILANELEKESSLSKEDFTNFLKILAPFAPHMAEELWRELGPSTGSGQATDSIHLSEWPKYDESKIKDEKVKIIVQVNGKLRDEIEVDSEISEDEVKKLVISLEKIKPYIAEGEMKKFVYVKGRIANIVI